MKDNVVGETNSGFLIIEQFDDTVRDHVAYVLGRKQTGEDVEYVTWTYNRTTGGFSSGHYFHPNTQESPEDALQNAVDDLLERKR